MIHWLRFLIILVVWFTTFTVGADAQQGRVLEGQTFHSDVLDRKWAYTIYLPPGYESSERAYPVFYLLHGLGGDHTGWVRYGRADMTADSLIAAAAIPPVILVMPDGGRSFWLDSDPVTGFGAVETALLQDLIPHGRREIPHDFHAARQDDCWPLHGRVRSTSSRLQTPRVVRRRGRAVPIDLAIVSRGTSRWRRAAIACLRRPFRTSTVGG